MSSRLVLAMLTSSSWCWEKFSSLWSLYMASIDHVHRLLIRGRISTVCSGQSTRRHGACGHACEPPRPSAVPLPTWRVSYEELYRENTLFEHPHLKEFFFIILATSLSHLGSSTEICRNSRHVQNERNGSGQPPEEFFNHQCMRLVFGGKDLRRGLKRPVRCDGPREEIRDLSSQKFTTGFEVWLVPEKTVQKRSWSWNWLVESLMLQAQDNIIIMTHNDYSF